MPRANTPPSTDNITKFTNCRLVKGGQLVEQDLWISSITGKILRSQEAFYERLAVPDRVIDLGGKIISPGLIDVQLNGAFGVNFSTVPEDLSNHSKTLRQVNRSLLKTGVTSYLPTLTSQKAEVYQALLPYLGPSGAPRLPEDGSESLGAHCEGPFLSPTKNGIHTPEVLIAAQTGFSDLEACYGSVNLTPSPSKPLPVRMITAAPEIGQMTSLIPELAKRNILFSIGHTEATYEEAAAAVAAGATMITHLFNAMRPLHHRNPGPFGVLGVAPSSPQSSSSSSVSSRTGSDILEDNPRPYFGIIADGIHLHPSTLTIAYHAHPSGFILVTDAMPLIGLPDGVYSWTNGENIVKSGARLTLQGSDKIAGSVIDLIGCVNNFLKWSGEDIPAAIEAVTGTPARMLGIWGTKGCLEMDSDADLCVFSEGTAGEGLVVEQVWKFGVKMFDREVKE